MGMNTPWAVPTGNRLRAGLLGSCSGGAHRTRAWCQAGRWPCPGAPGWPSSGSSLSRSCTRPGTTPGPRPVARAPSKAVTRLSSKHITWRIAASRAVRCTGSLALEPTWTWTWPQGDAVTGEQSLAQGTGNRPEEAEHLPPPRPPRKEATFHTGHPHASLLPVTRES